MVLTDKLIRSIVILCIRQQSDMKMKYSQFLISRVILKKSLLLNEIHLLIQIISFLNLWEVIIRVVLVKKSSIF